jgi:hypothetical protein
VGASNFQFRTNVLKFQEEKKRRLSGDNAAIMRRKSGDSCPPLFDLLRQLDYNDLP